MKKLLLALTLICAPLAVQLYAQNISIEWGETFESKTEVENILGYIDDELVAYSTKGSKKFIETYAANSMVLKSSTQYEVPKIPKMETGILSMTVSTKNVVAIIYSLERKSGLFTIYLQKLSSSGKPIGNLLDLYSSEASESKVKDVEVDFRLSPDKSKAILYLTELIRLKSLSIPTMLFLT